MNTYNICFRGEMRTNISPFRSKSILSGHSHSLISVFSVLSVDIQRSKFALTQIHTEIFQREFAKWGLWGPILYRHVFVME